jgi:hypothetical protein
MFVALPAGAFTGLLDLSGRLLDLYRLRRDGSYFDQQRFLASLRQQEAAIAESRWVQREEYSARIRADEAARDYRREVERDWRQARINIETKLLLDRHDRRLENSPLTLEPEEMRDHVTAATGDGQRPVLLIAPFYQEHLGRQASDDAPNAFEVALRRSWFEVPWSGDLAPLGGAIRRPLRNTDIDLMLIQQALHDMPVVLVCGEVQGGQRVWLSLVAWNVVTVPNAPSVHLTFPALPLPQAAAAGESDGAARLAFEDQLGQLVAVTAGMLGEWFHLMKDGRPPRLHTMLPTELETERRVVAANAAAAYEVAIQRRLVDRVEARVRQAQVYADAGLADRAAATAQEALDALQGSSNQPARQRMDLLRQLVAALEEVGDEAAAEAARRKLEELARRSLLDSLGME